MSGAVVRAVAARRVEGVFSVRAEFTPCGRYILYYHSKRRTLRKERERERERERNDKLPNYHQTSYF